MQQMDLLRVSVLWLVRDTIPLAQSNHAYIPTYFRGVLISV